MSLSWNEIKTSATAFANEWKDEKLFPDIRYPTVGAFW